MSRQRVLPVIVSVRDPKATEELREAFVQAERAEKAKIAHWARHFGFETTEPVIVELTGSEPKDLIRLILEQTQESNSCGAVVAGSSYLQRARLDDALIKAFHDAKLDLWDASLGSHPLKQAV